MRRTWLGMLGFTAVLFGWVGCQSPEPTLKPKLEERWVLPPSDDTRFSTPPAYPKEVLDSGSIKRIEPPKPFEQFKGPGTGGVPGRAGMGGGY